MNKPIEGWDYIKEKCLSWIDDDGSIRCDLPEHQVEYIIPQIKDLLTSKEEENKKLRKVIAELSHPREDGWCCACEADIAFLEGRIKDYKAEMIEKIGVLRDKFQPLSLAGGTYEEVGFQYALDEVLKTLTNK